MHKLKSITRRQRIKAPASGDAQQPPAAPETREQAEDVQSSYYGFKVWHDPQKAASRSPHLFDVIFVHGLTGDLEHTWTHPESTEPWPKTLIPKEFPGARVLSYGYDAYVVLKRGPVSSNRLSSHSLDFLNAIVAVRQTKGTEPRPLILIAHSLGGIVCKDALLLSSKSADLTERAVFNDTLGLIFMGTPHTGAGLAWWAKVPATALGIVKSTNKNLLDVLETKNETITRIQNEFVQKIRSTVNTPNEIQIVCFYETLPMYHLQQIVSFDSAVLPGYNHISIHADHKNMVKFLSEEKDLGCAQFFGILKRWEPRVAEKVASTGLSIDMIERKSDISVPVQDTCDWIFEDELYTQWTAISEKQPEAEGHAIDESAVRDKSGSDLLFISGKPGSGKSTLMKNLFIVHAERQNASDSVCLCFFFNARGAVLEKSPLGLYCSLLFQLLRSNSLASQIILPALREKEAIQDSRKFEWHQSEIAEQFHKILRDERMRNVTIFIDGMDECEDNDAGRDIVTSLEHSLQVSRKNATNLRVCLSSRPYRQIRPKFALELQVEARNSSDIALYVDRELMLHHFGELEEIKTKMISKASGVFLWIILVVKRLRTAWDRGCLPHYIRQVLEELPPKLEDLYLHITRSMTEEQLKTSSKIAQLVLCAKAPLTPNDVDIILALTSGPSGRSLIEIAKTSPINTQALTRFGAFLTETTGGLFEISTSASTIVVQVIHETVRDFLHSVGAQNLYGRTSQALMEDKTQETISLAIKNYALSVEVRANFAPTNWGSSHTTSWIGSCERSPPQHLHPLSHAVPEYFVLHGLEHMEASDPHPHTPQKRSELLSQVEGWLFAYAMMMVNLKAPDRKDPYSKLSDDDYAKLQTPYFVEVAQKFLLFIDKHGHGLGLTECEIEQLVICMNNRSTFFEIMEVMSRRPENLQQQPMHMFHLACWTMSEEGVSVVGEVKVLNRKRQVVIKEGPAVTPCEVTRMCCENGTGVAFTASFSCTTDSTGTRRIPDSWVIREDYNMFLRISGWEFDEVEDNSVERMPFHLNAENGYIAVILAQEPGAPADRQHRLKPPEVFAVFEQDYSKAWKREQNINREIGLDIRRSKRRLRPKDSFNSMRTNAPDRGIGLLIWYALGNLEDERKEGAAEKEPEDVRRQNNFRPGNAPNMSSDVLEQVGTWDSLISFLDPLDPLDSPPWNPLFQYRPGNDQR